MSRLNFDAVRDLTLELAALNYFPTEPAARLAVARLLGSMAETEDQIREIVRDMTDGSLNDWPGPEGLRQRFTAKFRPRDGLVFSKCSCGCGKVHQFRLAPNQTWPPQIEVAKPKLLPPPDPEVQAQCAAIREQLVSQVKRLPAAKAITTSFTKVLQETETAPCDRPQLPGPTPMLITQEQIAEAVAKVRADREKNGAWWEGKLRA